MPITNGTIKYGQTVKTGDYENKRADVELSFTVPEGEEAAVHIEQAHTLAELHCHRILNKTNTGSQSPAPAPAKIEAAPAAKPAPAAKGKAKPAAKKAADPAAVEEAEEEELDDSGVTGNTLDDLLGLNEAPAEITDKALNDAVQKQQDAVKNAPGIRKLLNEFGIKTPPGRLIDLEQGKRAEFIAKLQLIKPLA